MKEHERQMVNEVAAFAWFLVDRKKVQFDKAVEKVKAESCVGPIDFQDGVNLAKEWLQ